MNRFLTRLVALLATTLVLGQAALAEEAPPPGVLESFACNYREGQDSDNLMAARDYLVRQAERAGITLEPAFVWHTFKGNPDLDFLWLNVHENLEAFGRSNDRAAIAEEMSTVMERFGAVADCESNLSYVRQVFNGGQPAVGTPPSFINAFACRFKDGARAEDLSDLEDNLRGTMGSLETHRAFQLYASERITGVADAPDVFYFGVHDDATAWSSRTASLFSSPAGAQLSRHFNSILDCSNALFIGEQVVQGAN